MSKLIITLLILLSACGSDDISDVCKIQQGVHSWNDYMWPEDNYELTIFNSASTNDWNNSLSKVIDDWNSLDTVFILTETNEESGADIYLKIGESNNWLGLAEIWLEPEEGRISRSRVSLNSTLLTDYKPIVTDHVLCQEIGHVLGLFHIVNDSCMDDCAWAQTAVTRKNCLEDVNKSAPNKHDEEQLVLMYGPPPEMECD